MVVAGSKSIVYSKEGVTQGDPLSMFLYAIGTLPLIRNLNASNITQIWYADDASAVGKLDKLRDWFEQLLDQGPSYGYFPEPTKSYVIVDESFNSDAANIFQAYGVKVVQSRRVLGGIIGDKSGKKEFLADTVTKWKGKLESLSKIADKQPQVAYAALVKSEGD